jgi:hypothetical protein
VREGAEERIRVERIAGMGRAGALDEPPRHLVVDRALDEKPGPGGADLALVVKHPEKRVLDGLVEVGVGEDDVR